MASARLVRWVATMRSMASPRWVSSPDQQRHRSWPRWSVCMVTEAWWSSWSGIGQCQRRPRMLWVAGVASSSRSCARSVRASTSAISHRGCRVRSPVPMALRRHRPIGVAHLPFGVGEDGVNDRAAALETPQRSTPHEVATQSRSRSESPNSSAAMFTWSGGWRKMIRVWMSESSPAEILAVAVPSSDWAVRSAGRWQISQVDTP